MGLYKGYDPVAGLAVNTIVTGFNIFDIKWSDHLINDIQWLRADTFSWQSGDVYVTAYNKLVEEYSTGITETEGLVTFKRTTNGYKIADASQEASILSKYNSDGIAWYYILDTANKRFKLPRTKFGFEGIRGNVGDDIKQEVLLPNIKGSVTRGGGYDLTATGAMSNTGASSNGYSTGGGNIYNFKNWDFDASRSSSVYSGDGTNTKIQPPSTQMYLYFYVGEYSREAIEQTAGLNADLFNNKVDIDSSWGFPSNRYINLTLGASGSTYIAPANGWFMFGKNPSGTTMQYGHLKCSQKDFITTGVSVSGYGVNIILPVVKGDIVECAYNLGGTTNRFRFIYAEGSN